jgi:hypothetical protein
MQRSWVHLALVTLALAGLAGCGDKQRTPVGAATQEPGAGTAVSEATQASDSVPAVRYVANTGGLGVRQRDACEDGARGSGGWGEGTQVQVKQAGADGCAGWSLVAAGEARSWIRDDYLVETPPPAAIAAVAPQGSVSRPAAGVAPPAAGVVPVAPSGGVAPPTLRPPPPLVLPTFVTPGGAVLSVAELDGAAILQGGANGLTYLGIISSSRIHPDSVCNPNGAYGSASSPTSIRNQSGAFGSASSETSAYDASAPAPPQIRFKNTTVGYLTRGEVLGRGSVDPDFVLSALGCR